MRFIKDVITYRQTLIPKRIVNPPLQNEALATSGLGFRVY